MRNGTVCWGPECGEFVPPPRRGAQGRYHSATCRQRALRRNGGVAPDGPFPPLEPTPLQQDATAATVVSGSEQKVRAPRENTMARPVPDSGSSDADVLGQADHPVAPGLGSGNVTPPAGAPAGKAPAPVPPSPPETPPAVAAWTPEQAATHPDPEPGRAVSHRLRADTASAPVTQLHVAITENSTVPVEITVHPMVAAYKADVAKLGKAGTRQGLQVIEMAEKLVSSATSPAAAANLSKELTRMMDALEESSNDALVSQDPSLIIRDRTLAKLRAIQDAAEASA